MFVTESHTIFESTCARAVDSKYNQSLQRQIHPPLRESAKATATKYVVRILKDIYRLRQTVSLPKDISWRSKSLYMRETSPPGWR